jgi:hypothetical protein
VGGGEWQASGSCQMAAVDGDNIKSDLIEIGFEGSGFGFE